MKVTRNIYSKMTGSNLLDLADVADEDRKIHMAKSRLPGPGQSGYEPDVYAHVYAQIVSRKKENALPIIDIYGKVLLRAGFKIRAISEPVTDPSVMAGVFFTVEKDGNLYSVRAGGTNIEVARLAVDPKAKAGETPKPDTHFVPVSFNLVSHRFDLPPVPVQAAKKA